MSEIIWKGQPFRDENGKRAKFWEAIPFSRVIHETRGWNTIDRYVIKNNFESQGFPTIVAAAMAKEIFESARAHERPNWSAVKSTA